MSRTMSGHDREARDVRRPTTARQLVSTALAVLVTVTLGLTGAVGMAGPADAAEVGAITGITFSPGTANPGGHVAMNLSYCVPAGSKAGDTFSATIPSQFNANDMVPSFPLKDTAGNVVATAQLVGPPYKYVFTLTDYAEKHDNVCGAATSQAVSTALRPPAPTRR